MTNGNTHSEKFWTDSANEDRLAIEDSILGVATESYGHIRGELTLLNNANDDVDLGLFDYVVEAGLDVKSGVIQILDCPNSIVELEIKKVGC